MFEKTGNQQEDELFLTPIQIEVDAAIRKERRREDQEKLILRLKKILEERELGDLDFFQEFSQWQKTEQDIVSEIKDSNEYNEKQVQYLIREAEIFAEPGMNKNRPDLINEALNRLEGTEEAGYEDGALCDAVHKADMRIIDKEIVEGIESRIKELKNRLKLMSK